VPKIIKKNWLTVVKVIAKIVRLTFLARPAFFGMLICTSRIVTVDGFNESRVHVL